MSLDNLQIRTKPHPVKHLIRKARVAFILLIFAIISSKLTRKDVSNIGKTTSGEGRLFENCPLGRKEKEG